MTPSGMSAIAAALHGLVDSRMLQAGSRFRIVCHTEVYDDVPRLLESIRRAHSGSLEIVRADCSDGSALRMAVSTGDRADQTIVLAETCSNPHGQVFAFESMRAIKAERPFDVFSVVDDTWTTNVGCNALDLGADVVVMSLTKYMGGNAAIAGAIVGRDSGLLEGPR